MVNKRTTKERVFLNGQVLAIRGFFVIKCTLKLIIITKYIPCHLLVQNPDKEEQIDIKVKKISYQSEAHSQLRYQFEAHSVKVMIRGSLTVKVLV